MNRFGLHRIAVAAALATVSGCGLLEDATAFTVDTDWQTFTVNADALGLNAPGAELPAVPCDAANDTCAQAQAQISCSGDQYECEVLCGTAQSCEVHATVELATPVDISQKVQGKASAKALSKVTLERVQYKVGPNTLNFSTPQIDLYVGPNSAQQVGDAGVVRFATIEPVAPGTTPEGTIPVEPAGQEALTKLVKDYMTPFKFLGEASLSFGAGQQLPQGSLTVQVMASMKVHPL